MTTPPPSAREIADPTARLRALTGRRADEAEPAAILADREALLDRIAQSGGGAAAVQPPMTAEAAVRALAGPGRTLDDSRALVRKYLDDVSEQVGVPVHRWGLDEEDVRAIDSDARAGVDPEQARRGQLTTWHADDHGLDIGNDLVRER